MGSRVSRANPRVSVVMTAYQDLRFIDAAVKSVLAQTYADFEMIIVDDGTNRPDVFTRLAGLDARIRVMSLDQNTGTFAAANLAIADARGEIIARLDADDLAKPTRLARLVAALDADSGLGFVGSWAARISETDELIDVWQTPVTDLQVRWAILFHNPLCHSTVAFRRKCFDAVGGYNPTMRQSGDYELWWKMLAICRTSNIPEILTCYRVNSRGLTAGNLPDARRRTDPLRSQSWKRLGVEYEPQLVPRLVELLTGVQISDASLRVRTCRTAFRLLHGLVVASRQPPGNADDAAAKRLKSEIVDRVLGNPAIAFTNLLQLWWLCWQVDRGSALAALPAILSRSRQASP
jgi:hypothetical protein